MRQKSGGRQRSGNKQQPAGRKKQTKGREQAFTGAVVELAIEAVGGLGDGIGSTDGRTVFVPFTHSGDRVRAQLASGNANPVRARLLEVLEAAPERGTPVCRHFGACGGCQLQMMRAAAYESWMQDRVNAALSQHGLQPDEKLPAIVVPEGNRRRLSLKAIKTEKQVVLGFQVKASHGVVAVKECPVAAGELQALFEPLRGLLGDLLKGGEKVTVALTLAANGVDVTVTGLKRFLDLDGRQLCAEFAEIHDIAALHVESDGLLEPVSVRRTPMMQFAGVKVPLKPGSFVQASSVGEAALTHFVETALEEALARAKEEARKGGRAFKTLDLFAGMGTFTFPLATYAPVLCVEASHEATESLKRGVAFANKLKQVEIQTRDLYKQPLSVKELNEIDFLVFDPPRAGAKTQAQQIAYSSVRTVVAISCNPETFARDAHALCEGGYRFKKLQIVDQFLWSSHLEVAGLFVRE